MRREPRAEPERPHLIPDNALVPQPQLHYLREQLRNRARRVQKLVRVDPGRLRR